MFKSCIPKKYCSPAQAQQEPVEMPSRTKPQASARVEKVLLSNVPWAIKRARIKQGQLPPVNVINMIVISMPTIS